MYDLISRLKILYTCHNPFYINKNNILIMNDLKTT